MIYTCPKCGKKLDLTTETLINSEYKVICPQCLCKLQIVGDFAYIPHDELELDTTVLPSHTINCPKCGHEASSGAHFCPNCGTSFDVATPPSIPTDIEDAIVLPPPIPGADPLYNEAVQFLGSCTAITPMMLCDRFHITEERAAELIRQLEAGGVIGPYAGGGPRQILIPHRSLFDRTYPPSATLDSNGNNGNSGQRRTAPPRRSGCLTYLLVFMFIVILLRACGG